MKAVIKTGGKQYYVEEGSVIYVEKLDGEAGSKVTFDEVLMLGEQRFRRRIISVIGLFCLQVVASGRKQNTLLLT